MTIKDSGDHALEDNSCVVPGVPSVLHLKSYNVISFILPLFFHPRPPAAWQ